MRYDLECRRRRAAREAAKLELQLVEEAEGELRLVEEAEGEEAALQVQEDQIYRKR